MGAEETVRVLTQEELDRLAERATIVQTQFLAWVAQAKGESNEC